MALEINSYIVPLILSDLIIWSLRKTIKERKLLIKILVSFVLACLSIFIYRLSHSFFNGVSGFNILNLFNYNDLIASFVICFINLFALWAFFNLKKD